MANRDYYFTITEGEVIEDQTTIVESIVDVVPVIQVRDRTAIYPGMITVYNLSGQVIATGKDAVGLQHLSRGIYIVQGRAGSHTSTVKFTINS